MLKEHRNDGMYARATYGDGTHSLTIETDPHRVTVLVPILPHRSDPSRLEGHATTRARANRLIREAWYPSASVNTYQRVTISNIPMARYDVIGCSLRVPPILTFPGNMTDYPLTYMVIKNVWPRLDKDIHVLTTDDPTHARQAAREAMTQPYTPVRIERNSEVVKDWSTL